DLARALVDAGDADVTQVPFGGEVADVAVAAVDLERAVADPPGRLAREDLGDRRLAAERTRPALFHLRGAEHEQPRRLELGAAVGDHPLDGLKVGDGMAELLAIAGVG